MRLLLLCHPALDAGSRKLLERKNWIPGQARDDRGWHEKVEGVINDSIYEYHKNEHQRDALRVMRGDYRAIFEKSIGC